ncbi:MAG: ribosome-associated translation inhibitor RaiA [Bacteroidetes bacterium]|nr:ribosome-associated translation inhibitor RaiA [Bacteroidota bacterium]
MEIQFQSTNFKADKKLIDLITLKLKKLEHYYDQIIDASVYIKVQKSEDKINKVLEIKMNVSNSTLFVEEHDRTFENAIDKAEDALKAQLIKYKQKMANATI